MDHQQLVDLTADIVAAHVSNNMVAIGDVSGLIRKVHGALEDLATDRPEEPQAKKPIVSVRASVKPDYLVCLECGLRQKMLKRHLRAAHDMTPSQYRSHFGLPATYPMVAPNYSEVRRALAHSIGLGRKPGRRVGEAKPAVSPRRPRKARKAPQG